MDSWIYMVFATGPAGFGLAPWLITVSLHQPSILSFGFLPGPPIFYELLKLLFGLYFMIGIGLAVLLETYPEFEAIQLKLRYETSDSQAF